MWLFSYSPSEVELACNGDLCGYIFLNSANMHTFLSIRLGRFMLGPVETGNTKRT